MQLVPILPNSSALQIPGSKPSYLEVFLELILSLNKYSKNILRLFKGKRQKPGRNDFAPPVKYKKFYQLTKLTYFITLSYKCP